MKYLNFEQLERLNATAIRCGYNRALILDRLLINKNDKYPIPVSIMVDDGITIRCHIILNAEPAIAILDIEVGEFNKLPVANLKH